MKTLKDNCSRALIVLFALLSISACKASRPQDNFVLVTDVIPDAMLDIRYYCTYNFIGDRIPGYDHPVALLTHQAADSLKVVSDELRAQGYRIKIYDCYRPQKAVDFFYEVGSGHSGHKNERIFLPGT